MKIGIIGAGQVGACLAGKLTNLGHSVSVANSRGPASLEALAAATRATAATVDQAVKDVDIIVVAIREASIPRLPSGTFNSVPRTVTVVDAATTTHTSTVLSPRSTAG